MPPMVMCFHTGMRHSAVYIGHVAVALIDISPLVDKIDDPNMANANDLLQVVRMLDEACREAGFFYVKGHGISESLMREVRDAAHKFFQLPHGEKMKIKMASQSGYRGYQPVGENITMGKRDMHESVDFYFPVQPGQYGDLGRILEGSNLWPEYPSNFKVLLESHISLLKDLSRKIMRGIALALGGPIDAFEGAVAGNPFWAFRLVSYPALADIPEDLRTDTGLRLLTLVNQDDDIYGLEEEASFIAAGTLNPGPQHTWWVQNHYGQWIHAKPIPGTFLCNIGDMLKVWSNGIYQPAVHRVINSSPRSRASAIFFYEPNFDTAIVPVDVCKEKTGGAAKYKKMVYGEHLVQKLLITFPGINHS
ncbi:hypothetical protein ACP70R_022143 [Stipagrostis hirtigluma subsp. patula]